MNALKTTATVFALTIKRIYDLLASYLLFWVLYFSAVAIVLHVGFDLLAAELGIENRERLWEAAAEWMSLSPELSRLVTFVALHVVIFIAVRRPIAKIQPWFESIFERMAGFFDRVTSESIRLRFVGEAIFTIVVTVLLVPFVLQPTLVPEVRTLDSWAERAANLVDGTASIHLVESVVGLYRLGFVDAVITEEGVTAAELEEAAAEEADFVFVEPAPEIDWENYGPWQAGSVPMRPPEMVVEMPEAPVPRRPQPVMDRWDETIMRAVGGDRDRFAYVKAFMYVESGGRQYAVSRTGCAGLMQFCSGTARSNPFKRVFGTGTVYTCRCRKGCSIDRSVRVALESGDRERVEAQSDSFPCQLTDTRFDPDKAVRAGALYVGNLHEDFGGNIQIMYIGYNSGPAVARRVWRGVGENPDASLTEIEAVLPEALRPYYGKGSDVRARSLVQVHLPKIERMRQRYAPRQSPDAI